MTFFIRCGADGFLTFYFIFLSYGILGSFILNEKLRCLCPPSEKMIYSGLGQEGGGYKAFFKNPWHCRYHDIKIYLLYKHYIRMGYKTICFAHRVKQTLRLGVFFLGILRLCCRVTVDKKK